MGETFVVVAWDDPRNHVTVLDGSGRLLVTSVWNFDEARRRSFYVELQ